MTEHELKPGIIKDLSYDDYAALPALRNSDAKHFRRSAAHARYAMLNPSDDTTATLIGNALHVAVLEPKKFLTDYAVGPAVDKRTKDGKAEWAAFVAKHPNAILLRAHEYAQVIGMAEAIEKHPFLQTVRTTKVKRELRELSVVWNERVGEDEVLCKCRIDWAVVIGGETFILDIKTTEDATPEEFQRSIFRYSYHAQSGSYLRGLNTILPSTQARRWIWIVVEKNAPYGIALYEASEGLIEQGVAEYTGWVRQYRDAVKSNNWTGYPSMITPIDLPKWAWKNAPEVGEAL